MSRGRDPVLLRGRRPPAVVGVAATVLLVAVCTALVYPLKHLTTVSSLGVVYLLGVVIVSAFWGLWFGVGMSVLSAAAFNFRADDQPSSGAKRFPTESCAQPISLSLTEMTPDAPAGARLTTTSTRPRSPTARRRTTSGAATSPHRGSRRHCESQARPTDSSSPTPSRAREQPLAVILELALPDLGGIELCQRLRERGQMPIPVLSAIDNEAAKIKALESGADDYIAKPFSRGELVARLAARLRAAPSELRFELDGLTIDLVTHRVTIDGDEVHLTPIEFALLRVLATSRGPVTYQALAASVWGTLRADPASRVRTHIHNLRAKLDPDQHRNPIRTEVAIGYRFARPAHASSPLTGGTPAAP